MKQLISSTRTVLIKMGTGSLKNGFPDVNMQLITEENGVEFSYTGNLPESHEIIYLYEQWKESYLLLHKRLAWSSRMHILDSDDEPEHVSEKDFQSLCDQLGDKLNDWFITRSFQQMERHLVAHLRPDDHIQVIFETNDNLLRKLPWHLWNFFEVFPQSGITLSPSRWQALPPPFTPYGTVRILAVFGSSEGINLEEDKKQLNEILNLPETDIVFLEQPSLEDLTQQLNDSQGWDILFYAGHSFTDGDIGRLCINSNENRTIRELKNALQRAIVHGLRIAIFNSCDGLGLARELEHLNLPRIIVMREPVNDYVAHTFSKYFLKEFSSGKSFDIAVGLARQQLQGIEDRFPCASWLPVICQHPEVDQVQWHDIQYNSMPGVSHITQFFCLLFGIGNVSKRWWNRPLIGQRSMTEQLITHYQLLVGRPVPSNAMRSYRELISKAERFSRYAQVFEDERFQNAEFKHFLKLKKNTTKHDYPNLTNNILLLQQGLEARQRYLVLGRTAYEFRGRYHQIYYEFIKCLILDRVDQGTFLDLSEEKYQDLSPKVKTTEGLQSLKLYFDTLHSIAINRHQYKLLYSFKHNRDIQYRILHDLNDIVSHIPTSDILDPDSLNSYVLNNQEIFNKLGRLIGIPNEWNNLHIHKLIVQHTAYMVSHDLSRIRNQFQLLLMRLRNIAPVYRQIHQFRNDYCRKGYTLNLELLEPIPGVTLFKKYEEYL